MICLQTRRRSSLYIRSRILIGVISFISGYLCHHIISYNRIHETDIVSKDLAKQRNGNVGAELILVILIFSSINNFNRRQTIRETWLSDISTINNVKHYFVISGGNAKAESKIKITEEQEKFKDLVIFPYLEDSFYLLTEKLIASYGWLTDKAVLQEKGEPEFKRLFTDFKFVLKCDDDSFVRVKEIVNELKTTYSNKRGNNLYWGFFDGRARVKKTGKYKEDNWDVCDYYVPYALGGGYILAKSLVEFIAKNDKVLKKYRNEDVSVGAWLSNYAGINKVHDPRFDTEYISRGCHQSYLITHKHSENEIKKLHLNLKTMGHLCIKEYKTRISYIYNWDVPPSKCCIRSNPNIP